MSSCTCVMPTYIGLLFFFFFLETIWCISNIGVYRCTRYNKKINIEIYERCQCTVGMCTDIYTRLFFLSFFTKLHLYYLIYFFFNLNRTTYYLINYMTWSHILFLEHDMVMHSENSSEMWIVLTIDVDTNSID